MPRFCAVLGCGNRSDREHDKNFFFFPRCKDTHGRVIQDNVKKRDLWVEALYRRDFTEKHLRSAYVCSDHFVSGRPSTDPTNEDYVPSVHMGYETKTFLPVFGRRGRRKRARTEEQDEGCSYLDTGETVVVNHAGGSITLSNNPISWEEEEHLTVFDTERDVEYLKKEADFLKIQLEVKNDELREVREELSLVKSEYKKSRNLLKSFCIHNNKRGKLFV